MLIGDIKFDANNGYQYLVKVSFYLELKHYTVVTQTYLNSTMHGWLVGCIEFIVPLENFSLKWRPFPVKGCKFWPMLGTYGYWAVRFFNVPLPLRHGPTVYNGHLRGPLTLTLTAERLAMELSLSVSYVWCDKRWNSDHKYAKQTLFQQSHQN